MTVKPPQCDRPAPILAFRRTYICAACGVMSDNRDDICYPAEWEYKNETNKQFRVA